jgi:DNA repair exonuclease SbcCD nuclease subunit/ABC-type dipeptide/oligopeptide/nickel transport system ATPase component
MKFAHIADTHIRNLKYHYEYNEVFQQLYKSLKENKVDYIVHCGDIAHTKTQISPEFVDMCRDFFENLSSIAPTYVILGNHDGNLRNSDRQDALSPIARAINSPNLHLIKNAGEVNIDEKFCLNVLSVFDEENWIQPTDTDMINIALYHGAIDKSKTDLNWTLGGDHDVSIFDNFDFAFLGDIHKTQHLDAEKRIWYAGSTVQQNFGESLDKGYLLWEIDSKDDFTVDHIAFDNPKPFITIPLTRKGDLPKNINPPEGARLRIVSDSNVSLDKMRKAVAAIKYKYDPESVTYLNRAASQKITVESAEGLKKKDLRDIKTQETLIRDYLKDFQVSDSVMRRIFDLNAKYNTTIERGEDTYRNVSWSLKTLEWDHLFNYGEGNRIDFSKLEGIVGIFGKNFSGKSSIVDSLLFSMYNSTSKSIRKNLNIINQNKDDCVARATIDINDTTYVIERSSEKYVKKLKGEETLEAKTDLEFSSIDLIGNNTSLNGTSRQDTDKSIRKYFGSMEDFLLTSMASQMDSLSFVNEGSTKRKEILAKFLDLVIFDKKFKMAKEDSALTKGALKKLENIDYDSLIEEAKKKIMESEIAIVRNKAICETLQDDMSDLTKEITSVQDKIDSVPAEIIDITSLKENIDKERSRIATLEKRRDDLEETLREKQELYSKIDVFMSDFDIEDCLDQKSTFDEKDDMLAAFIRDLREESEKLDEFRNKERLLQEVPCGSEYSHCKFIKDAYDSISLIDISEGHIADLSRNIREVGVDIQAIDYKKIEDYISKYDQLLEKKNTTANALSEAKVSIAKTKTSVLKTNLALKELLEKEEEYEKNREAIENLELLIENRTQLKKLFSEKDKEYKGCHDDMLNFHKSHGSYEEKLKSLGEQKEEYEILATDFAAYDLLMTCSHPNGISYDIIKERLPIINQEIAKVLTNIVEFEIFIQNEDKKLDIFIKHPKHDPRPLEMGSGAEKTIASMAIRLAFLTVSSLPKSDLFILDEPGTALDEENMEGFTRILDMVKGYFKTVLLISHLDTLKDCVDMQISIERKNGYAHVNI